MLQVKELAYAVQKNTVEGTDMADIWPKDLQKLLEQFEAVFKTPQGLPPNRSFVITFHYFIQTKLFQQDLINILNSKKKKKEIKKQIQEMLQLGVRRPSSSPFASPVVLVKKSDGIMGVGDYAWTISLSIRTP